MGWWRLCGFCVLFVCDSVRSMVEFLWIVFNDLVAYYPFPCSFCFYLFEISVYLGEDVIVVHFVFLMRGCIDVVDGCFVVNVHNVFLKCLFIYVF